MDGSQCLATVTTVNSVRYTTQSLLGHSDELKGSLRRERK